MKKASLLLLIVFMTVSCISALSLRSSVLSLDADARFSSGFYPLSGKFRYDVDLPDFLKEAAASVSLNFDSGLKHRLLMQNPENGVHLDTMSEEERETIIPDCARYYQVQYVYSSLDFSLGLVNVGYLESPILALTFSLEGDFENAYERLGWLSTDGSEATFSRINASGTRESRFKSYSGVPELAVYSKTGYRQLSHTGMKLALSFSYKDETRMTKDGLWGNVSVRYMPTWFPFHDEDKSYFSVNLNAGAALTLLDINQFALSFSDDVLKMFTLVLETEFDGRFLTGDALPQYALERSVWGSHTASSAFYAGNTTSLVFRGPQIKEDVYPVIRVKNDSGFAFGKVANGEGRINRFSGSISIRFDADFYDTLYLYAECGYVYASVYQKDKGFRYTLGVRLGI